MVNDILNNYTAYNPYEVLLNTNNTEGTDNNIINKILPTDDTDAISLTTNTYDPANLTADKILEKINEKFYEKYGIGGASEEDEANSEYDLSGVDDNIRNAVDNMISTFSGLYTKYCVGREDDDETEKLENYMKAIREGVQEGYEDAVEILKANNNYGEDVEERVASFMNYLNYKLDGFENTKKDEIGKKSEIVVEEEN